MCCSLKSSSSDHSYYRKPETNWDLISQASLQVGATLPLIFVFECCFHRNKGIVKEKSP